MKGAIRPHFEQITVTLYKSISISSPQKDYTTDRRCCP
nr:MAG TPA: hypothetical protein [Caudoviricetes sp.]